MQEDISPSLAELEERIAIVRDNLRELTEQAAAFSGAEDEERNADRIRHQHAALARRALFLETLVAGFHGLGTVRLQGMSSGGGIAILSDGQPYELALHWGRVCGGLSEGVTCHQQNRG